MKMKLGYTKHKFGGQTFVFVGRHRSRSEAKKHADSIRVDGYKARVTEEVHPHFVDFLVWSGPRRNKRNPSSDSVRRR